MSQSNSSGWTSTQYGAVIFDLIMTILCLIIWIVLLCKKRSLKKKMSVLKMHNPWFFWPTTVYQLLSNEVQLIIVIHGVFTKNEITLNKPVTIETENKNYDFCIGVINFCCCLSYRNLHSLHTMFMDEL